MDVVKICEVVDGREDCPKYGDDCDGDKMTEHTDLISRADAIDAVRKCVVESELLADWNKAMESAQELLSELPSADAEFTDLPDIPRYYYEKVVGKMAHEINILKEQLESADAVQGEWKIDEYGIYHCPFCHAINNTVYKSFCPNCGARMYKGGDDE